jgi:hypothetical protein
LGGALTGISYEREASMSSRILSIIMWLSFSSLALLPFVESVQQGALFPSEHLMMPVLMGGLMLIALIKEGMAAVRHPSEGVRASQLHVMRVLTLLGAVVVLLWLIALLGFSIASLTLLVLGLGILRENVWWRYLLAAACWLFTTEVLFKIVLRVPLPEGSYSLW